MTLEELRTEAHKQGYSLVKKKNKKLLPCTCGHQSRSRRHIFRDGKDYIEIICNKCGKNVRGTSEQVAINNWNKEVSNGNGN